jgi:hypothetical protein
LDWHRDAAGEVADERWGAAARELCERWPVGRGGCASSTSIRGGSG